MLDSTVVFNEIMYHPPQGSDGDEWIELHNQMAVDMDLSNWTIDGGVSFEFPANTRLPGGGYLVVARNTGAMSIPDGVELFGPFEGRLSNGGEQLRLRNRNDRVMDVVDYSDSHPWPAAADGTGASLAKRDPQSGSSDASNWTASPRINGTPGMENFVDFDPTPTSYPLVPAASSWTFSSDPNVGIDWLGIDFDDADWMSGEPIFYHGNFDSIASPDDNSDLENVQPIIIQNPSFESNTNFGVGYGRISGWEISGATGINPSSNGATAFLDNGAITDGRRVAFLQGDESLISQELSGLIPSQAYELEIYFNARNCCNITPRLTVSLGGEILMDVDDVQPANDGDFHKQLVKFVATAEATTLTIANSGGDGDHTLLVDSVAIYPTTDKHVSVSNPSFEASGTPAEPGDLADAALAGWEYAGSNEASIGLSTADGSQHDNGVIPSGNHALFISGAGSINQTVQGLIPGQRYEIAYRYNAAAASSNAEMTLSVNDSVVVSETVQPVGNANGYHTVAHRFVAPSQSATISISQNREEAKLFVDDVTIRLVDSPLLTLVPDDSTTHYFRHEFEFSGNPDRTDLLLSALIDDAAVLYLNGQEIWRHNLPDGPIDAGTLATFETKEPQEILTTVFNANLNTGLNIIAAEVHQADSVDNDMAFSLEAIAVEHPVDPNADLPDLAINEVKRSNAVETSVELFNHGAEPIDLSRYIVRTGDQPHALDGVLIANEARTFSLATSGSSDTLIAVVDPHQNALVDAVHARDVAIARHPDGTGDWFNVPDTTANSSNRVELNDAIVINEIMYHHQPNYVDYAVSNEEWIEIYNRTDQPVNLSGWSFTDAVDFVFADGTTLDGGSYLVVAREPDALIEKFPNTRIVGGYAGQLNNGGENIQLRDHMGNLVDEVHYYDSGRWPVAADGGGASLELIDPDADNSIAESWRASTEHAEWKEYSFRVTASTPRRLNVPAARFHEIIFGLLDAGEVLLDDIRVIEEPTSAAIDRMQNGDFESDAPGSEPMAWRIIGNHHGEVVVDPDDAANHVLKLTANGPTEHMHNHAEVTFADRARIDSGAEYEITFKAKWLSGSPLFNSRLYFVRGAKTTVLDTSTLNGTPGAPNDSRQDNSGPTYSNLHHDPIVPEPDEPVTVTIFASDPDGVTNLTLHYAVDRGDFDSLPMELQDTGEFSAQIPGQGANDVVNFFVTGTDGLGASSNFPAEGRDSRALYRVENRDIPNDSVHSFRLILTPNDVSTLHANTNVMSNGRLGATVIYNDAEIFYDVGVRMRASGYGRQGSLAGFNVKFHDDQLFRDVHESVSLDHGVVFSNGTGGGGVRGAPGASPHELLIYQIAHHAGGIAGMYDDVVYVDAPRAANSGLSLLKMARYTDTFLDSQYDNGSDGSLYKFELFYHATSTIDGDPESLKRAPNAVVGTDISNLGEDEEAYRLQFILKNNRDKDDFAPMIELGKTFSLSSRDIGDAAPNVIDVDQWMRTFALTSLVGTADTYNMGLAHNLYVYERPSDGKVLALPWDVDHGFYYSPTAQILGAGTNNLRKIVNLRPNRRLFYKHLLDIVQTTYNPDYLAHWIEHYSTITDHTDQTTFFGNYVTRRSEYVLSQLDRVAPQIPFEITTNGGNAFSTDSRAVIEGTGWIDVDTIRVNGQLTEANWLDQENWSIHLPVREGVNNFTVEAFDLQGRPVGSDTISITGTQTDASVIKFLRIPEIMYNPSAPTEEERTIDSTWDNDDFEFIEFLNISTTETLELAGLRITKGPTTPFVFDAGYKLLPGERTVVVANRDAFVARYGESAASIGGQYDGRLSNGGESLRVETADGITILAFTYSDAHPWPEKADGEGFSLQLISPSITPIDELSVAERWRASAAFGGTPGRGKISGDLDGDGQLTANDIDTLCQSPPNDGSVDLDGDGAKTFGDLQILIKDIFGTTFGDANLDGQFDSSDLVAVFQSAQYEDDHVGNSTWATGDWNCDGEFSTSDLVVAFRDGKFVRNHRPLA